MKEFVLSVTEMTEVYSIKISYFLDYATMEGYELSEKREEVEVVSYQKLVRFIADYPRPAIFEISRQTEFHTTEYGILRSLPKPFKKVLKNLTVGKVKGDSGLKLLYFFNGTKCRILQEITPKDNFSILQCKRKKYSLSPYLVNGSLVKNI